MSESLNRNHRVILHLSNLLPPSSHASTWPPTIPISIPICPSKVNEEFVLEVLKEYEYHNHSEDLQKRFSGWDAPQQGMFLVPLTLSCKLSAIEYWIDNIVLPIYEEVRSSPGT